jgi:hypothetical protein
MAMTLEQKVARLKLVADGLRRIQEFESARYLDEYADHLTQPAQAVDVGAIRDVIETVKRIDPHWSQLPKLERALSAEKVGWRDGLVREARRCVGAFEQFAGRDFGRCDPEDMHLVIVEAHHGLSCALLASPTPDKEG